MRLMMSYSQTPFFQEATMGQATKAVVVPLLVKKTGLGAMDLVRMCNIAVGTAYKAIDPIRCNELSLDICWKIYEGLKANDIVIKNGNTEREIEFSDIVKFDGQ